jgi:ribosome hibernation promoting factor
VDLVLKGRGVRITDQIRKTAEHKMAKIGRRYPKITRVEVEITLEHNPRINGSHRVEVACDTAKHVFRATGAGQDVDTAFDQVIQRLERQITSYRGKLRDRRQAGPMGYNPPKD